MAFRNPRVPVALPPTAFVRTVLRSFMRESGLEPRLLGASQIRVTSAVPGKVEFELDIINDHTNRFGTLHGGTIASMVDLGGSLAVASFGQYVTGVSTDLNVTYTNTGGKVGDKITATAVCDKMGKTLAFTSVVFRNYKGELAARGSHTKYLNTRVQKTFILPKGVDVEIEDFDGLKGASAILHHLQPDLFKDTQSEAEDTKS
ncbi:thioesterase superfamily protein [Xylaria castorea]|nr:thioesterase superfamily protein [Xylaria castorea]